MKNACLLRKANTVTETKTTEKRKTKQKTEEETAEIDITTILANHEERLRAIESWIFRLKNL